MELVYAAGRPKAVSDGAADSFAYIKQLAEASQ